MNLLKRIQPAAVRRTPPGKGDLLHGWQAILLVIALLCTTLLLSILLTHGRHFSVPVYQSGDIARTDVIVPMDILIEDETATEARRAEVKAKALPVYRYTPSLQDDQVARLKRVFAQSRLILGTNSAGKTESGKLRARAFHTLPSAVKAQLRSAMLDFGIKPPLDDLLVFLVREGFHPRLEDQIILLVKEVSPPLVVEDDAHSSKQSIQKVNIGMQRMETVPVTLLATLEQVRNKAGMRIIQGSFAVSSRPHIRRILDRLVIPNLIFDEVLTKSRLEEEIKNIDPVLRKLKKGRVVLRQGDEVGSEQLAQIEALRKLSPSGSSLKQTVGMAFLVGILLMIFVFFVRFNTSNQWRYLKLAGFLILALTVNLLLLKASWFVFAAVSESFLASPFNDKTYFFYLLPFAYGSMLVTLLAGERCAQLFIIFFCILAGQSIGMNGSAFFYILITNLAGIIFIRKATQRIGLVGAGFRLGLSSAVLYFILQAAEPSSLDLLGGSFGAALAFLSGLVNTLFLVFTLPLCERLFMVTTEIRLSELGNLNLPLIRDLVLMAPGTYNHSIAVGTLCEGAAKAIGLNPLFLRIASLYHDVGKTFQPEYFVENQKEANLHDRVDALESAHILRDHITYGMAIASKANLPSSIVDLIPQHHGTKVMQFFFEKAKKEATAAGREVQEDLFRYPGPKPQTKAAAILMLADGIEAAARTLNDHSQERLFSLIQKIITDTTEDGQFAECDITLSEINRVTYSFLETLSSYYHGRIAYPGFDFNHGASVNGNGLS